MIDQQKLDALSDEFQSTFSIVRHDPDVIANMCAPHECTTIVELIKKYLGWEVVTHIATGQLEQEYDIYFFAKSPSHWGMK